MNQPKLSSAPRTGRQFALSASLVYAAFGAVWILASDQILLLLVQDAATLSRLQTYKGWFFVAITALLLFVLVSHGADHRATAPATARDEPPQKSRAHLQYLVALATSLLIAVILVNLVYHIRDDRKSLLQASGQSAQNLAQVLEEQTAGMINAVDLTLLAATQLLETDQASLRVNKAQVLERLRGGMKSLPFVRAIYVTDDKGVMTHHTEIEPDGKFNFADRDYFLAHRDGLTDGLFIGRPVISRVKNSWLISMSRRLSRKDGSFAGLVAAAIEPNYLESFYRKINVGAGGTVSLFLRDGTMLVRSPPAEGAIGRSLRDAPLFTTQLPKAAVGTYEAVSQFDPTTRIFSYRALPGRPLVVVIGLDRDEILAKWRSSAWTYGLISAVFILILAWLGNLVFRAIDRRDQATRELLASEQRFRKALDGMLEGCQVIGFDWRYHYVNDTVLQHGRATREALIGRTMMEVYPGIDKTEMFAALRRSMEQRVTQGLQNRFEYADGGFAWFDLSIQPVPEGVFVLSIDITAQKFAEESLRKLNEQLETRVAERTAALDAANKELEAFGYTVSHDLRAPLRHLDGFARLALDQSADMDEKTREYLAKIIKSSDKMGRLIDDLLILSRASRTELQLRSVDLTALISGVRQECLGYAGPRDVEWQIDPLPPVQGDLVLLRQVFTNLIGNALKFTRNCDHAVIEVRARLMNDEVVEISVRDNGAGFDSRYIDKLFGVFQRLHHEREFEGTGIGLAIVRRIIERHGGKTWAEGNTGAGASIFLTLKRAADAPATTGS